MRTTAAGVQRSVERRHQEADEPASRWSVVRGDATPSRRPELFAELVNANPASEDFLIPTRVEGDVREVRYPTGEPFRFDFSETPLSVYQGEVTLRGEVQLGAKSVTVTHQACDDERCLPPVTRTVPLEGAERR